ncbi:MAG: DUF3106 domain-containing protein [Burkholderiaceae bacterium]|nr:DUF3106 domain-containing protein [Burkholderiaceae bacterium]
MATKRSAFRRLPVAAVALAAGSAVLVLSPSLSAQSEAGATAARKPAKASVAAPSGLAWSDLSSAQQRALAPLAGSWSGMTDGHKRKWIAQAANHASLSEAEQAKQHERMTDWAALSPAQRAQARLNFARTKALPADEKKAKWDAYQALSAEERRSLAAQGREKPRGAAPATRPVPAQKLATVPQPPAQARPVRVPAPSAHPAPAPAVAPHVTAPAAVAPVAEDHAPSQ